MTTNTNTDNVIVDVCLGFGMPPAGAHMALADLMAGKRYDAHTVYRMAAQCEQCAMLKAEYCPYAVAMDYSTDNGQTWADKELWCQDLPLPDCPIAQAVKSGKLTWDKVTRMTDKMDAALERALSKD